MRGLVRRRGINVGFQDICASAGGGDLVVHSILWGGPAKVGAGSPTLEPMSTNLGPMSAKPWER